MTDTNSPGMEESLRQDAEPQYVPVILKASTSHQIFTLVGSAFIFFEFIFLNLYFDRLWFSLDLSLYGIPAIFVSLLAAHLLLSFGESKSACRWFAVIFKGKPLVVYRNWLQINEDGIAFGLKQVRFEAIDELELTLLGNLIVKSRLVCGASALMPDKVLRLPFSVADFQTQEILLSAFRRHKPDLVLNKRLSVGRGALLRQGAQTTQLVTAAIMALLLLDVGYSSFYYLELLKNYFLAETLLLSSLPKESGEHFARAENLRLHPLPFSWVSFKFLNNSSVAAGIWEQRSRVLWLQGKHAEAIEDGRKAIEETPTNLRHRLYQTRLLVDQNKIAEAQEQLKHILKDHKHSLMPRLYILAIIKEHENADKLSKEYKAQLDACYADTYDDEPNWPPGGNCFFTELFYSDDARFLLDRFLTSKYELPSVPSKADKKAAEH